MNTRLTRRDKSEIEMNNDSEEERDKERDDERNRERDEERNRERDEQRNRERDEERNRERDKERNRERDEPDAMSRRVTGAESQIRQRGVCSSKRTINDGAFGGTPPKRTYPETVSSHTYTEKGARPKEPVSRYCGSELADTGEGTHIRTEASWRSDRGRATHQRKRLFGNNTIDPDIFMSTLVGAVDQAQPAEVSELTTLMDRQQLEASFKHMVKKWKELRESLPAGTQPCRPSTSDSQLLRPATGTYTRATPTSPSRAKRLLPHKYRTLRSSSGRSQHAYAFNVERTSHVGRWCKLFNTL